MKIVSEAEIERDPRELFEQLTDLERVAPCLPGVTLQGRDGDDHLGRMAIRVGPISATYEGRLRYVETDAAAGRAVIRARGEEVNGNGNAEATIVTEVSAAGAGSRVRVETDVQLRGRLAQFGRGALDSIAGRMLDQFAANLERMPEAAPEDGAGHAAPRDGEATAPAAGTALGLGDLLPVERLRAVAVPTACAVAGFAYGYLAGRLREARRRR